MSTKAEINKVLTNVSIQYKNKGFIGQSLYPLIPVKQKGGKYKVYNKPDRFTLPNTKVSPKGNVPEVSWDATEESFYCQDHGLREFIPTEELEMASEPLDAEMDTVETLTQLIQLDYEKAVKTNIDALPVGQKDSPTNKWDTDDGDPKADIQTAKESMWVNPNTLVLSLDAYNAVVNNPKILERIKYTSAELPTSVLARLLEVDQILIAGAKYNAGTKKSADLQYIWQEEALLAYVEPNPSLRTVTLGGTITPQQGLFEVYDWETQERGSKGGKVIKVVSSFDIVTMCSDCAFLLNNVLSS